MCSSDSGAAAQHGGSTRSRVTRTAAAAVSAGDNDASASDRTDNSLTRASSLCCMAATCSGPRNERSQ